MPIYFTDRSTIPALVGSFSISNDSRMIHEIPISLESTLNSLMTATGGESSGALEVTSSGSAVVSILKIGASKETKPTNSTLSTDQHVSRGKREGHYLSVTPMGWAAGQGFQLKISSWKYQVLVLQHARPS